ALGLLGGLHPGEAWVAPSFMAVLVAAVYVADHPRIFGGVRRQVLTLDDAYVDEQQLIAVLEELLDAKVLNAISMKVDLVRDITTVDVRYEPRSGATGTDAEADGASGRPLIRISR